MNQYEVWRRGEVESAEKEWEKFRDIVMECSDDVCGEIEMKISPGIIDLHL